MATITFAVLLTQMTGISELPKKAQNAIEMKCQAGVDEADIKLYAADLASREAENDFVSVILEAQKEKVMLEASVEEIQLDAQLKNLPKLKKVKREIAQMDMEMKMYAQMGTSLNLSSGFTGSSTRFPGR